eukprot:TRINITY_DN63273_c0_g1_i1.p1 TRINITY_DN63273_c0_g1~~TRINITY_DN63273_c0_g1_i1.p1  ORF type:complete len:539 (+),score=58.99 TRINITY_DN63273_c0_g1_i1:66-1619(+)
MSRQDTAILVCQAGACRQQASEAVLKEIEELADGLGRCSIEAIGCLGACRQAPNVLVVKHGREQIHTRVISIEKSAAVVQWAIGQMPNLEDPALKQRLEEARSARIRVQARESSKWNRALGTFAKEAQAQAMSLDGRAEYAELLDSAGLWQQALSEVERIISLAPTAMQLQLQRAELLGKLGRDNEIIEMEERIVPFLEQCTTSNGLLHSACSTFAKSKAQAKIVSQSGIVQSIRDYAKWTLDSVSVVSAWSAIYHFSSKDRLRGTPNPRGRGRTTWPKTWHTTLLATVGDNKEGPLSWVERDYTPISSAEEWERGKCDVLIKIYLDGQATQWLHKQQVGSVVWLSKPKRTLYVPALTHDLAESTFNAGGVLLVVGGTGIAAALQILQHRGKTLRVPVALLYSCRKDDILMVQELASCVKDGRLTKCTLFVTETRASPSVPFQNAVSLEPSLASACSEHVVLVSSRITRTLLEKELALLPGPHRVVVSGPEAFNGAITSDLQACGIERHAITVLEAA